MNSANSFPGNASSQFEALTNLYYARRARPIRLALLACGLLACEPLLAQNTWNGSAGTTNWSTPGNWSFGWAPLTTETVVFDNTTTPFAPAGVVDNIVDANFTITALEYGTVSTNGYHTTLIGPGLSLNINGATANAIWVGRTEGVGSATIYERILGPGTLTVTNTTGDIYVVQGGGGNNDHPAVLDLSGLTNFSASLDQLLVGAMTFVSGGANRPMGRMYLAETNYIQTAAGITKPGILVAGYPGSDTNLRGTQQMFLGRHNVICADAIAVGGFKSGGTTTTPAGGGQVLFRSGLTGGYAILRGSLGGTDRVKLLTIGDPRARIEDFTGTGTSAHSIGAFDTSGNFLDLSVADMMVGRSQISSTGNSTGTATFDMGTIDADNLYIGYHETGTTTAANATGTVNVNGTATVTVNNDLVMARKVGTGTPVGTLNVASNGTVNVKGNLVTSGGTSTLNFNNGGTVDLQPAGDPTPGNLTVSTLTGNGGVITNAANVTNLVALTPGGLASAGSLTIWGNLTLATNAAFNVNLTNAATIGGGVNDYVSVNGNLTLNNNVLNIIPIASSTASGSSYRLIDYTGTRNGSLSFTNPTRYALTLDYPANQVNLNVSGSAGNVRWNSASSTAWDTTTSNWFNLGTSAADKFYQLDSVVVNDSGAYTNLLLLNAVLFPNTVTVNSSSLDYFFGGSGRLSGAASLTKNGNSMLTVSNANDFTGPVQVNAGTLRVANSSALGANTSGTTIANGATLDINGVSLYNPGEPITIAGTGVGGNGAIINSGAAQNNAIRSLTLSDDATIRQDNRFDVRGPGGNSSFSGTLDLGGFTLTKVGAAQFSLADVVATNAGSFDIQSGTFAVTRSLVDGPGVINLYTNVLQIENSVTGYCAKPIISDGGVIRIVNNSFALASPVTNLSGVTFDVSGSPAPTLTLTNVITGAGGVLKSNAGSVFFGAVNPYSGPTTINAGSIELGPSSGLPNTPSITIAAGAILNVTNLAGGLTLASGQQLSGGTVLGDLTAGPGSTVAAGTSPGTLALGGNATFNNATVNFELGANPTLGDPGNDLIVVTNNLGLSGVTTVNILPTATLNNASPYTLFQYGSLTGGSANLNVVTPSRYSFTVLDPTTTVPYIQVQVAGSGTAASLLWRGGAAGNPNAWDFQTTSNWLNGASLDKFYAGDNLTFDDTATTGAVTLIGTLSPAGVALNNSALAYTFGGSGAIASGYFTNWNGGSLLLNNSAANTLNGLDLESGTVTLANAAANTVSGPVVVNAGSLTFANAGGNTFGAGIVLNGGTLAFNQPVNTTVSATIGNTTPGTAGTLVKQGSSVLTLSGNNATFDGPILVSAGILKAGNANALGTLTGATTVADGATLDISGTSLYNPGDDIIISGFGLSNTGAVINTGAAQNNAIRSLILSNNASIAAWGNRWDIRGPGGSGSLSGNLNLNGFTLTKLGPGQNSIVDAYVQNASVIDVFGGTLAFTRCDVPAVGNVNLYTNTLVFDNYSAGSFSMPVTVNGGIIRLLGNGFSFDSLISNLAGGVTFDNGSGNTLTVAGAITGPGALAKTGANTVVLASPSSTWTGSTTIGAGTLQIGTGGSDGSLPDLPIIDNGTLTFNSLNSFTITQPISGSGGLTQTAGGIVTLTASNSYAGTTALNTTATTSPSGSALRISNSYALGTTNGNTTINGNTGANGSLELVGNNMVVPEAFSLSARQTEALIVPHIRNVSGNNTLTGQITGTTGGNAYNIQSDGGLLTVAGNFVPPSTAGTRNLKLMGDGNGLWSGIVSNSADGLVPTVLNKYGLGTWTLSGSNVYFGSTIIATGTLALAASGSINSTPLIEVQTDGIFNVAAVSGGYVLGANQTLRGNGTVLGNVTANGTITPGTSIGTLTFANNLVLAGTNIMELDRANVPNADLIVAGALTSGGELVINNIGEPLRLGDTFDLFNATSFSGGFIKITLPALGGGLGWDTSTVAANGIIKVIATVPTTPTNIGWNVSGNSLTLSWPENYKGWTLLEQINNLASGISTNNADWGPVAGSTTTNAVTIPIDAAKPTEFYRLAFPYP